MHAGREGKREGERGRREREKERKRYICFSIIPLFSCFFAENFSGATNLHITINNSSSFSPVRVASRTARKEKCTERLSTRTKQHDFCRTMREYFVWKCKCCKSEFPLPHYPGQLAVPPSLHAYNNTSDP